jgi:ferrous iron transport protein B
MKVLLVGQPNVGKSSLLNALTGAKVIVSNYPGTTVEVSSGKAVINGEEYVFLDTPGAYSLSPSSEEEKVTDRMVLEGDHDFVIQVVDATSLERSLIMTLQLSELGVPMILALNFWEEAEARGIIINLHRLEEKLGVPVVRINPVKGKLEELVNRLGEAKKGRVKVTYDDHIEEVIGEVEARLGDTGKLSKRGVAVKLVENDPVARELFGFEGLDEIRERHRKEHPNIETDIMVTRAGYASLIAREVQRIVSHGWRLNWLDNLIINNPVGSAIFTLAAFTGIFAVLLYLGGWFQDVLGGWFDSLLDSISPWLQSQNYLVRLLVENSLTGLAAGISVAVPYIFIFYFILAFLEDSGILARFVVVLNKLMSKLGLPGKSVIPIMLGFGCTVPAIRATRVLPEFRDRLKVAILYMTVPCSSRSGIIFGVVGHYAGAAYAVGIYVASFGVFVITAKLLNVVIPPEKIPMVEELPPYRKPLLKNIALKAWIRMQDFVYIVIPLLIAGGMAYGALLYVNLVQPLIGPFRSLTEGWLHLPAETIVPLLYGFLQKDLVPAMLANVLGTTNFSAVMSNVQLFTFGLASTFQVPCIIAFSMLAKEFGLKRALIIEVAAFAYGMLWAGIIGRIVALALGVPF